MNSRLRTMTVVVALLWLLSSCATTPSTPPAAPAFAATVESEKNSGIMDVQVKWTWGQSPRGAWDFSEPKTGFVGFDVTFVNQTNKAAMVVWEQSAIVYNRRSFFPFVEGQKFAETSRPMSPMVVPAFATVRVSLFSSDQARFETGRYGGWRTDPIEATDVTLVFFVRCGGIEDFYSVIIRREK